MLLYCTARQYLPVSRRKYKRKHTYNSSYFERIVLFLEIDDDSQNSSLSPRYSSNPAKQEARARHEFESSLLAIVVTRQNPLPSLAVKQTTTVTIRYSLFPTRAVNPKKGWVIDRSSSFRKSARGCVKDKSSSGRKFELSAPKANKRGHYHISKMCIPRFLDRSTQLIGPRGVVVSIL